MKKIVFSLFATSLLLTQVARSEVKIGDGTLTFNAAVNSRYVARGIEQNNKKVTPSVGTDFNTPFKTPAGEFGLYLGAWASKSAYNTGANRELDIYGGITKAIGPATLDLGYIAYDYSSARFTDVNNAELYLKLTVAPDKSPFTFGLQYFKDDTGGAKYGNGLSANATGAVIEKNYKEVNATYDFGVLQSKLSYGLFDSDTKTTTLNLSKSVLDATVTASFVDAKKDGSNSSIATDQKTFILGVSKTF